jgi:uncharacterized protein
MKRIDLTKDELKVILKILENRQDAVVFGSRTKGKSKKFSDLDICLKDSIKGSEYELLKEAFEESNLPFKVDLIEYDMISPFFKDLIDKEGIKIADTNSQI